MKREDAKHVLYFIWPYLVTPVSEISGNSFIYNYKIYIKTLDHKNEYKNYIYTQNKKNNNKNTDDAVTGVTELVKMQIRQRTWRPGLYFKEQQTQFLPCPWSLAWSP